MKNKDVLASRLLSRATSIKETSGDILEKLRLLDCKPEDIDRIVVEPENSLTKEFIKLWKNRGIKAREKGCIHVKFTEGTTWYSYPFNFDVG